MASRNRRNRVGFAVAMFALVLAAGCSHFSGMHWPWTHKAPPPPVPVNELVLTTESGATASYPQYWKRNTPVSYTHLEHVYLTDVHAVIAGDTQFPELAPGEWRELEYSAHAADADHAHAMTFRTLKRRVP